MAIKRFGAKLIEKKVLIDKTYLLTYEMDSELDFEPGQFVNLTVAPRVMRAYSIVGIKGCILQLLINTTPGGEASKYFDDVEIGSEVKCMGPIGRFGLVDSKNTKNFVATGTGLAPFVAMINKLLDKNPEENINLFFGVRTESEDYSREFFREEDFPNFNIYSCVSREKSQYHGRVGDIIPNILDKDNIQDNDFYLCGSPAMAKDLKGFLSQQGCQNIYTENFGR